MMVQAGYQNAMGIDVLERTFWINCAFIILGFAGYYFYWKMYEERDCQKQIIKHLQQKQEMQMDYYKQAIYYETELRKIKHNMKNQLLILKLVGNHENVEKYENEIEWIEIISVGTKYIVRVEERKINNIDLDNTPRHIVSKKDAVIKKVVASNGEIIKNVDSYVKKGDIVVSGEIKLNDTIKNVVKAEAKVYGEVWYKVNITIPLTYYEEIYTNNKLNNYSINFLNRIIKLKKGFKNKKEDVEVILKNKLVPISFNKIVETEIKKVEKKFTIDEAIKEGTLKSRKKIEEKLTEEEYIINEIELKVNVKNSKIELEMFYTVYEDITDYKLIS